MAGDVAVREEDITSLVRSQIWDKRRQFDNLLPADVDVDSFAGLAAAAMWKNPQLAAASMRQPESLLIALRECARLGHEPGTDEYALTIRGGGVLGIEQYQGVISRMFRSGCVQAVHAEVVAKDETLVRRDPLPPDHRVPNDDWLDRDLGVANLKGAYAYAILEGGLCSRVVIMGRSQIMTHREKAGIARTGTHAGEAVFWDGPFGLSMWLKTCVHELEKWVPTSATYRKERAKADAAYAQMMVQPAQAVTKSSESLLLPASVGAEPQGPSVSLGAPEGGPA